MPSPKYKRCAYCYKRVKSENLETHYYSGNCLKAQQEVKAARPVGVKKKRAPNYANIIKYGD